MIPSVHGSIVPARSITDVANASGVSIATVSRALRGLPNVSERTRAIVRKAADDLGYVGSSSASGLASGRTMTMGVIVPSLDPWFCTRALEGIGAILRTADYDLILFTVGRRQDERERLFRHTLLRRRTDALMVLCTDVDPVERELLTGTGHPVISVGGRTRGLRHVDFDNREAARIATKHLADLGHTRIAHLAGTRMPGVTRGTVELRRRGYELALRDAGIDPRPDWVRSAGFETTAARDAATALLRRVDDAPTAVFADSDELAVGAMLAAGSLGLRVPDELSVISIGDKGLAKAFDLTAVAVNPYELGARAARVLLDELAGSPARAGRGGTGTRHPVTIVDRGSTASPSH